MSLQQIPLGVAYAIRSGLATVGAVLVGVMVWHERRDQGECGVPVEGPDRGP